MFDPQKFAADVAIEAINDLGVQGWQEHARANGLAELNFDQAEAVRDALQGIRRIVAATADSEPATTFKTIVPSRWPEQKLHDSLAHARAAVGYGAWHSSVHKETVARGGRIFELRHGAWHLVVDVPRGTPKSELPWKK